MGGTFWNSSSQTYDFHSGYQIIIAYNEFRATFCAAWLGVMIAVGTSYYILSSEQQKKSNLFRLQLLCISLAIFYNLSEMGVQVYQFETWWYKANRQIHFIFFELWLSLGHLLDHIIPLISDSALLFRLSTFFPYPVFSKRARFLIFLPFHIMILIRFILGILTGICYALEQMIKYEWVPNSPAVYAFQPTWTYTLYDYAASFEIAIGSLFCFSASSILLTKAYRLSRTRVSNQKRIQAKMQFFAEALTMCFVPPFFLNIAAQVQLWGRWNRYLYFRETQALNVNLSVIFSILATSWSSIREKMANETGVGNNLVETSVVNRDDTPNLKDVENTM